MAESKKRIPVKALREFAKEQGLDIAVLFGWCKETNLQHVVTWGRTVEMCDSAAQQGNHVKRIAGWPENDCNAEPSRVKKLKADVKRYREWMNHFIDMIGPSDMSSDLEMALANGCAAALDGKDPPKDA